MRLSKPRFGEMRFGEMRFGEMRFGERRFGETRIGETRFGEIEYGEMRWNRHFVGHFMGHFGSFHVIPSLGRTRFELHENISRKFSCKMFREFELLYSYENRKNV